MPKSLIDVPIITKLPTEYFMVTTRYPAPSVIHREEYLASPRLRAITAANSLARELGGQPFLAAHCSNYLQANFGFKTYLAALAFSDLIRARFRKIKIQDICHASDDPSESVTLYPMFKPYTSRWS